MSSYQQQRAKMARKAFQALGTPTTKDLKAVIQMNLIKNRKITAEDVNLAEKAFGPDIGSLKSKTARKRPIPVFSNMIDIPTELLRVNEEVEISLDGLRINRLHFISNISHDIFYRMAQYIQNTRAPILMESFDEMYNFYKECGFTIIKINCDKEFKSALDIWRVKQEPIVKANYANSQDHADLQADFKILPVAVTQSRAWRYAFAYDIAARHYPELDEQSRSIDVRTARIELTRRYFISMGAGRKEDLRQLFGWRMPAIENCLATLAEIGILRLGVTVESRAGEAAVLTDLIEG